MEKKKPHDKHSDIDSRAGQSGDISWWQREMFKNFVGGGSLDSDFPPSPYFSAMPWSHPQHLWAHPLLQRPAHSAMPQSPGQTCEQEKEHEGQQGGTQSTPSEKPQPSSNLEKSGPSAGTGRPPFHSMSTDSSFDDLHNMGGTRPPYSYPGGLMFPMPPYPGHLDPLMLWMHQMRRQAAYSYSTPGCRKAYQSPLPVPSAGANQRGFIKIPSGIPQKQTHLWETQSSENMQLWATITQLCATVSRAEAEILFQRGKISKLEDDLEAMRTRQDALSEAVKGSTVSPQTRRERRKRTATVPVAILGLPAFQPLSARAQVKKARGIMNGVDSLKPASELDLEGNCKQTRQNITLTSECIQNGNGNCTPHIAGLNQSGSRTDTMDKDMVDALDVDLESSGLNVVDSALEGSSIKGSLPGETTREASGLQNIEVQQECITDFSKNEAGKSKGDTDFDRKRGEACAIESITKQTEYPGDCCRDSEMTKIDEVCVMENMAQRRAGAVGGSIKSESTRACEGDNRSEGVVIVSEGDSVHGGSLSNSNSMARPNAISLVADWHHAHQNGQVGGSAQQGKQVEPISACTVGGFDGTDEWTNEVMEVLK